MKNRNQFTLALVAIAMFVLVNYSCDRYLDIQSDSKLVVPQSLDDFQKLLDASELINFHTSVMGEISADDYFLKEDVYDIVGDNPRAIYQWTIDKYIYQNDWSDAYSPVYVANLVIDGIESVEKLTTNESLWKQVYGSALYIRSNQYLGLVWTFSKAYDKKSASTDLGIVLRNTSDPNVPSVRANVSECYDFILNDLRLAAEYLPERPTHVMRPSKGAAYATLARTFLSMGKFDSAYYYVDKALVLNSDLLDFNSSLEINPSAANPFSRFNKETVFYAQLNTTYPNIHPVYGLIDSTLFDSYEYGDLRKELYFNVGPDGYASFKGSYSGAQEHFSGISTSEQYLIKAECLARLDRVDAAVETLNHLLVTRWKTGEYTPYMSGAKSEVLQFILQERRKELVMRGLRWIDIKRLNLLDPSLTLIRKIYGETYKLEPNDLRYALPLPDDIIQFTGMPQNER